MTAASSATPPLAKYLASTDKRTRDKSIKKLSVFLSESSENALPKEDMDKLWKGIFYCFWMSDKPLVQQALADELAELVLMITTTSQSLAFLRGFWETIVREWSGIDRLRIDKYYMLVRRYINASFKLLSRAGWDKASCEEYNDILTHEGGPLCPSDLRVPTSLAYHLADIYTEELDKVMAAEEKSLPAPLNTLLAPFFNLAALTPNPTTYHRVQSALLEPLFRSVTTQSASHSDDNARTTKRLRLADSESLYPHLIQNACVADPTGGKLSSVPLKQGLSKYLFRTASNPDTKDSNRRKMYTLWKEADGEDLDD
ncbi:Nop52-domain-containing protein [Pleurotus eryngii]|uniref:Nop52-domain-containing protein n=1 Tax=Pleurotus eryngii TaxID=5323 RepID=A0A9P6DD37_PLEER|nr:Nop52-domain-containing protein [Pleurotus eryngii]